MEEVSDKLKKYISCGMMSRYKALSNWNTDYRYMDAHEHYREAEKQLRIYENNEWYNYYNAVRKQIETNGGQRHLYKDDDRVALYITLNREKNVDYVAKISTYESYSNNNYLDGCGYTFYKSLSYEYKKYAIDKCGFYLEKIAEMISYNDDDESLMEFLNFCMMSDKIPDKKCIDIIDGSFDLSKAKEHYTYINENAPYRYNLEFWILSKIDDVSFVLRELEKLGEDVKNKRKNLPYLNSKKATIYDKYKGSYTLFLPLAKHIIDCLKANNENDDNKIVEELARYLKVLGNMSYGSKSAFDWSYIIENQLEIADLFDGEQYVNLLEKGNVMSSAKLKSYHFVKHPLEPVYNKIVNGLKDGNLSENTLTKSIKYVAGYNNKAKLMHYLENKNNIIEVIQNETEKDRFSLFSEFESKFSDKEKYSILMKCFNSSELIARFCCSNGYIKDPNYLYNLSWAADYPYNYQLLCSALGCDYAYLDKYDTNNPKLVLIKDNKIVKKR